MNKKDLSVSTGFSTLSIASLAYNIHLKADISNEFDRRQEELIKIVERKVQEKLEIERERIKKELYNEILNKLKKEDDWEKIEKES